MSEGGKGGKEDRGEDPTSVAVVFRGQEYVPGIELTVIHMHIITF